VSYSYSKSDIIRWRAKERNQGACNELQG